MAGLAFLIVFLLVGLVGYTIYYGSADVDIYDQDGERRFAITLDAPGPTEVIGSDEDADADAESDDTKAEADA